MKRAIVIFLFCLMGRAVADSPTALVALEEIRGAKGEEFLKDLVEVRGVKGETQPRQWVFLFNDPGARGGVREMVVQEGKVFSERTPAGSFGGTGDLPVLAVGGVEMDTGKIFRKANDAAVQESLGFHWIDYILRVDGETGKACWFLSLTDIGGGKVAEWVLGAETLEAVAPLRKEAVSEDVAEKKEGAVKGGKVQQERLPEEQESQPFADRGILGRVEGLGANVLETIRKKSVDVAGGVEEVVTGERRIGVEEK